MSIPRQSKENLIQRTIFVVVVIRTDQLIPLLSEEIVFSIRMDASFLLIWCNGYVLTIIFSVPSQAREVLADAMADWENYTCTRFIERTNEEDYVNIINDDR